MKITRSGPRFAEMEMAGGTRVWALCDGYFDAPPGALLEPGNTPIDPDRLPFTFDRLPDGQLRISVNCFLVETADGLVMIDTGSADAWLPTMGRLAEAMADAAIVPNDVTTVAITHTHPDHINGLILPGGASAFPRLKHLFVPQEEIGLFQAEARLQRFHAMVEAIADGDHIAPDITVVAAHGHEIGHSGFKVVSGRDTLLIWGDIVHVPGVQFPRPDVTWVYDTDQSEARRSRLRIFDWAARDGLAVAGAHLDFPGVGFVERLGDAFRFKPLP